MKSNVQKSKDDKYDKIINRTDELRKESQKLKNEANKDESTSKNKLPIRTFITGRIKGKIIDLDYIENFRNNKLKLKIRLSTKDIVDVLLTDTGEYEEQNELVRLLYTKNISDYAIEDLLGQKVKLKSKDILYDRSQDVTDVEWVIDTPEKYNFVGKMKYKFHNLNRLIGNQHSRIISDDDIIDKIFITFMASLIFIMLVLLYTLILVLPLSLISIFISLPMYTSAVMSFILALFTPLLFRTSKYYFMRYERYMDKDSIKN